MLGNQEAYLKNCDLVCEKSEFSSSLYQAQARNSSVESVPNLVSIMEASNESFFNDSGDDNMFTSQEPERGDDLAPTQKRAFVKMLAKFIRCAICLVID